MPTLLILLIVLGVGTIVLIPFIAIVAAIAIPNIVVITEKAKEAKAQRDAAASPVASWPTVSLDCLTFQSPLKMKTRNVPLTDKDGTQTNKLIVSWDSLAAEDDAMYVLASVITYTADTELSLDRAVRGAMEGMAAKFNVPVPDYQASSITLDGLPARRVDTPFTVPVAGGEQFLTVRIIFVQSGQRLVQLTTVQNKPGDTAAARAQAILDSVSVTAP